MSSRISFTVEGIVQGVNFRNFTVKQAKSLGLTGFVKNASDGTVVGEAQGESSALKELVNHLNEGPSAADVNKVDTHDIETKSGEQGFKQ